MTKKLLVAALAVMATLTVATSAFATTSYCTGTPNMRFIGVGSSAQTNALAYAAVSLLQSQHSNSYALISFGGSSITDSRASKSDTGITTWLAYDPSTANCDAYVYFQTDSGVGVKDFFAYEKFTASNSTVSSKKNFVSIGATYAVLPSGVIAEGNKIPGLPDACYISGVLSACDSNGVPLNIVAALGVTPETYVNQLVPPVAPSYCGNVSTVAVTAQFYCYFNAAGTDIRPEDALYATNRALAAYNGVPPPATHGGTGLSGEGYGTTATSGCTPGTPAADVGCGIWDSFAQNAQFNVLKFALTGPDPIKAGTVPHYSTLSVGAAPMMVIVGDETTTAGGLGHKTGSTYDVNDINRQTLVQVFSGYTACVGDLLSSTAGSAGDPLQVIHRESLSGTYNTFEFTAVRTQQGGPLQATATPVANADSGQENFNSPVAFPGYTGSTDCTYSSGEVVGTHPGYPNANCFDPMYLSSTSGADISVGKKCPGSAGTAPGLPVRLRAIGSGMAVKAVVGSLNNTTATPIPNTNVYNPIGYAFWSYANLGPLCSGVTGTTCTGSWTGHYLTVDAIDPLFITEGGQYDPTPNPSPFNPPVCAAVSGVVHCNPIPFTHIYDGKYPLWSLLRTVSFAPYSVSGKPQTVTPPGVFDMIATEETTSADNTLSDYVPFLKHVCPPGEEWTEPSGPCAAASTTSWNGDLNLLVFRSHFKQTGATISPINGHYFLTGTTKNVCPVTGVLLQGGTFTQPTCYVDFGNDVGGSVVTVQKDFDFILDFNTEEYGLRQ